MNTLPVDRALSIYETLADRSAIKGTRERLSKHLMKIYLKGEKDTHRLTVHGLSYLRNLDREIDFAKLIDPLARFDCLGEPVYFPSTLAL